MTKIPAQPYLDLREAKPHKGELICLFPKIFPIDKVTQEVWGDQRIKELTKCPPFLARFNEIEKDDSQYNLKIFSHRMISGKKYIEGKVMGYPINYLYEIDSSHANNNLIGVDNGNEIRIPGGGIPCLRISSSRDDSQYYRTSIKPNILGDDSLFRGYEGWYVGKQQIIDRFAKDDWLKWWCPILNKLPTIDEKLEVTS